VLQPRPVEWDEAALTELERIAAHEPRAAPRAIIAAERMGKSAIMALLPEQLRGP